MQTGAIIVAAGRGTRAGGDVPKQYRALRGVPVLLRSLRAFTTHPEIGPVVVVRHPDDAALYAHRIEPGLGGRPVICVDGGATRAQSVRAGLAAFAGSGIALVLVHDAARPLVSGDLVSRVIAAAARTGGAAPALGISDTLWRVEDTAVGGVVAREGLFAAQTPQGFDFASLCAAHADAPTEATDDVAVARAAGLAVTRVEGEARNIKITTREDFAIAARWLGGDGDMDIRTGNGFDVHAFGPGNRVILCGVEIAHDRALKGHSDADVAMHALTDALYGALGAGDIGRWFPPSDAANKDAASERFLRHAAAMAHERGFAISHADCTIICEAPRIAPHADAMRASLAAILGIDASRVSVKATTSEGLGFTGRNEGIAALATATLAKP